MKVGRAILFQLYEHRWSVLIYYIVIAAVFGIGELVVQMLPVEGITINGTEFSTGVFLFITGALFMKVIFPFYLQTGLSRGTSYVSSLLSGGIIAAGMTVVTNAMSMVMQESFGHINLVYPFLYGPRYGYHYTAGTFFEGLLWNFVLNLALYMMGLFFSAMFYRLSRILRTVVLAGIMGLLFIVLPLSDAAFNEMKIFRRLAEIYTQLMGITNDSWNPYIGVLTFVVIAAMFAGGEYLFLRRAPVKK